MGAFDKKTGRNIGLGSLIIGGIAVLANISQIKEAFFPDKSTNTDTHTTIVAESPDNSSQEKNETPKTEKVTQPPTEPQPTEPPVVYLDSLKLAESDDFYDDVKSAEDTVGNMYSSHLLTIGYVGGLEDAKAYGMYYLGGKYKALSGTVAVNSTSWDGKTANFMIYSDDNLIYDTGETGKAFAPTELSSLNVEGCQWLKFEVICHSPNNMDQDTNFILSNFRLEQ